MYNNFIRLTTKNKNYINLCIYVYTYMENLKIELEAYKKRLEYYETAFKMDYQKILKLSEENKKLRDEIKIIKQFKNI